jgi:hypothetical protein
MEEITRKKGHAVGPVDRGNMEEIMRKKATLSVLLIVEIWKKL